MKYLPFLDGKYSTAPALTAMAKAEDKKDQFVFQLDDSYEDYLNNKAGCRLENLYKYYVEAELYPETQAAVNRLIVQQLTEEYPAIFTLESTQNANFLHNTRTGAGLQWKEDWIGIAHPVYTSLFDALCSQVQEDVAICQLDGDRDWLAAIHLSAPNHWAPAEKIGRPFSAVHAIVPGMEKLNQQYFKMLVNRRSKRPVFPLCLGHSNRHPVKSSPLATARC